MKIKFAFHVIQHANLALELMKINVQLVIIIFLEYFLEENVFVNLIIIKML
jgi:hypothetical protein